MTLQKFRLAYLLVVVLTVTTVYAIADFNQGMSLELSDAQMQQLSGADSRWKHVCYVTAGSAECYIQCTLEYILPDEWAIRKTYYGSTYFCRKTNDPNDWCNLSNWGTFCRMDIHDNDMCDPPVIRTESWPDWLSCSTPGG